jgi:hypothetical protein
MKQSMKVLIATQEDLEFKIKDYQDKIKALKKELSIK